MPIYEYRCKECGEKFEALRKMEELDQEIPCPKCKSSKTERTLSTFAAKSDSGSGCGTAPGGCGGG